MRDDVTVETPIRILAVADLWQGSDAYAYVRAFRRMGHSVRVVAPENYVPSAWKRASLKAVRRLLEPALVREYGRAIVAEARFLRPHVFFVFKGRYVIPEAVDAVRELGAVAVNVYPDVSFMAHGKYLPRALPRYDWIFQTKRFGIDDLSRLLGVRTASFIPHSYDPEVHCPVRLADDDEEKYGCDVSFIGTWSPKKQDMLEQVKARLPELNLRVWGEQWGPGRPTLGDVIQGREVLGVEFAKALAGSKVNIAILSEARAGASSGDKITSRTFHIPGTGGFMLHERTDELLDYFREGTECACFDGVDELVRKIAYYLAHDEERRSIAAAGRLRCLESDYSVDDRARTVLTKALALRRAARKQVSS